MTNPDENPGAMKYTHVSADQNTSEADPILHGVDHNIPQETFRLLQRLIRETGILRETPALLKRMVRVLQDHIGAQHVIVFYSPVPSEGVLEYGACYPAITDSSRQRVLEALFFSTFRTDSDDLMKQLLSGQVLHLHKRQLSGTRLEDFALVAGDNYVILVPLLGPEGRVVGIISLLMAEDPARTHWPEVLASVSHYCATTLHNAIHHNEVVDNLATNVSELNILQQIDAELNATIRLDTVFQMIMDWALRFTNASAGGLALYDHHTDTLTLMGQYGYHDGRAKPGVTIPHENGGITLRVARSGMGEIVADVQLDKDYIAFTSETHTQMSMPIFREQHVIAVLTLESRKVNGFKDMHFNFVDKLTRRAGVAVDNARLFTETNRERQKLSHILSNIGDVVIVIGEDRRVLLINQSAVQALHLPANTQYVGLPIEDVIHLRNLLLLYETARQRPSGLRRELELPNGRTYSASLSHHEGVGTIIAMQDVTPYKEMDRLKNELVATVSHDLKQPLSVMRGYLDLLNMTNTFSERSQRYMAQLNIAFQNMRQLIDDILDMARIEAGLSLNIEQMSLNKVLMQAVISNRPSAEQKAISLQSELPELPEIHADESRIRQVFSNLINNAIKYTPPEGRVDVSADIQDGTVSVYIKDNGLGISAEDQAHIFERFYRVRRPETENIDGTGLGLAIVRSLVEAHQGEISVSSSLGRGSTFRVDLPLNLTEDRA